MCQGRRGRAPEIGAASGRRALAQAAMWWVSRGSPATGKSGLGTLKESGRKRVPRDGPPMRMTALTVPAMAATGRGRGATQPAAAVGTFSSGWRRRTAQTRRGRAAAARPAAFHGSRPDQRTTDASPSVDTTDTVHDVIQSDPSAWVLAGPARTAIGRPRVASREGRLVARSAEQIANRPLVRSTTPEIARAALNQPRTQGRATATVISDTAPASKGTLLESPWGAASGPIGPTPRRSPWRASAAPRRRPARRTATLTRCWAASRLRRLRRPGRPRCRWPSRRVPTTPSLRRTGSSFSATGAAPARSRPACERSEGALRRDGGRGRAIR